MVAVACVAVVVVGAGLAPGTGLASDARGSAVIGGVVFGALAVQDAWRWWRRGTRTFVGLVVELRRSFFDPTYGERHEDHAMGRMWHSTAEALSAHVAWLCTRDGMTDVCIDDSAEDPQCADVFATTADGMPLLVRVNGWTPANKPTAVGGAKMRRLADDAARHDLDGAKYAYVVAEFKGNAFTAPARRTAKQYGITMLTVEDLGHWEIGSAPPALGVAL
ncbi:hypothetical protein GCM10023205_71620 [Yinghuangia aomiensis]|uniref:Restriction endonuclease n=2 Tax=Yinghuangia aomiensis TaxID=676205 RepID=A0ABP9I7T3_9ACTN